ncbi:MAG TPA: MerR family transcriptional regulator [Acidimicrobiales bacterium]|nr:MerR family transcriptional regulator [Acidimicrobiales bacterium]
MAEGFSGREAADIVGITYRQLDYWARTDLIRPSLADAKGSGSRRRYSYQNLVELKMIKTLLDAGQKLERVREAFQYIRDLGEDLTSAQLVIAGNSVLLVKDEDLVDVVNKHKGQGVLNFLAMDGVAQEVDAAVTQLESTRGELSEAVVAAR